MLEIALIRHAPVAHGGRLIGRTDLPATLPEAAAPAMQNPAQIWCSPAKRCRQTAAWLFPQAEQIQLAQSLWEQDFGDWDGTSYAELPDLGPLDRAALARHHAPRGESFLDVCNRVERFLDSLSAPGPVVIVAHAGVIRAALGLALGTPEAGLSFVIDPLSQTRLTRHAEAWAIEAVNLPLIEKNTL